MIHEITRSGTVGAVSCDFMDLASLSGKKRETKISVTTLTQ
jgi:hypothetical protein